MRAFRNTRSDSHMEKTAMVIWVRFPRKIKVRLPNSLVYFTLNKEHNVISQKTRKWNFLKLKTSKFGKALDDIRIKKIISTPIWATNFFFFFLESSALLDVRHCPKLQSCAISRQTIQTWKYSKKPNFGPNFAVFGPNLAPQIFLWVFTSTRCYSLLQAIIVCNFKEN